VKPEAIMYGVINNPGGVEFLNIPGSFNHAVVGVTNLLLALQTCRASKVKSLRDFF